MTIELPDVPGGIGDWVGVGGARIDGTSVRYTLSNAVATRIRPRQPTDPVPVLATPRLAAAADERGLLPLQIAGERVTVRVVDTVRRFPGVDGQGVVGDGELAAAVNLERPGAAGERGLAALRESGRRDAVERALAAKPFNVLDVQSRLALEEDARRDPIAHGTLLALIVAALVALGLALAGSCSPCSATSATSAAGCSTSRRREHRRACCAGWCGCALTITVAGLLAGAVAGLALAAVVTDLVGLTARATAAEPPLVLDVDLGIVGAAVVLYVAAATALVLLATRRAFTAPAPGRVEAVE